MKNLGSFHLKLPNCDLLRKLNHLISRDTKSKWNKIQPVSFHISEAKIPRGNSEQWLHFLEGNNWVIIVKISIRSRQGLKRYERAFYLQTSWRHVTREARFQRRIKKFTTANKNWRNFFLWRVGNLRLCQKWRFGRNIDSSTYSWLVRWQNRQNRQNRTKL